MSMFTVLLALSGVAEATTVIVPTQQPNLTSAVAALSGPGPHLIQILVDNTYDEPGTLDLSGMDVTITGTGSDTTIIRVTDPSAQSVFLQNGGRLVLEDVTVNGDITNFQPGLGLVDNICTFASDRVGILSTSGTVELYDTSMRCFFSQGAGAAIRGISSNMVIDGSHFEQNLALGSGGHIYAGGGAVAPSVEITDTEFEYGFSAADGGAVAMGNVIPHVRDNAFRYNDAVVKGGALSISTNQAVEIWENSFEQNLAFANLTFNVFDFDSIFDTGNITNQIDFRLITGDGGAVYVNADNVDVWANLFCGNMSNIGGAVHLNDPALSTVQNNIFSDNWAIHYGGGIYVKAEGAIAYPAIWNNTIMANSAGVTLPPQNELVVYGGGGGAFFDGTVADIHNNIVARQQNGGGIGGVDGPNFIVGDPLIFQYNLWFENLEGATGTSDLVSDYDSHTLDQTNVIGDDPFPTWVGFGELDCYPDAFYPEWGSPTINRGDDTDPAWTDIDGTANDIGYTGGDRAPVLDRDGDGYMNTLDCNDLDFDVNPGAVELCDIQDNDCDGEVDEGYDNVWYEDADGDGWGTDDPTRPVEVTCAAPVGFVPDKGDCDDTDPSLNPGSGEVCDGVDNDCNGTVDDEDLLQYVIYYPDGDGDGFGRSAGSVEVCADPGAGWATAPGDCDDSNAAKNPNSPEICDGEDNDCDGQIDNDATDSSSWYIDSDGDGYGSGTAVDQCASPGSNYVNADGDCDDNQAEVNPTAAEVCDGFDNDCNGDIDDDPVDGITVYEDADGDGFLDEASGIVVCSAADAPSGFAEANSKEFDCDSEDDTNSSEQCLGSCSCQVSPANPGTGMLALMVGLLAIRRRRD